VYGRLAKVKEKEKGLTPFFLDNNLPWISKVQVTQPSEELEQ